MTAWLHTLDPVALHLGPIPLRWYGLSYAAGFLLAYLTLRWLVRRGACQIPAAHVGDAVVFGALGAVIGGRLGYVLFYQPSLIWTWLDHLPWWGVLAINEGGMASHGGMIGVVLAAWRISRGWSTGSGPRQGACTVRHVLDMFALCAPAGLLLGRLANFVNGELLGRIVAMPGQPAPWWAVKFPQERLTRHAPALTAEQQQELLRLIDTVRLPDETYLQGYERLLARIQDGAPELAHRLEPLIAARVPSQLLQAAAEGIVVGLVVWWVARRPRRPGQIGAAFLISYGVLRVLTELVRLPDDHLAVPRVLGLSRGQWFSVVMIIVGVAGLAWIGRRREPAVGGWGAGRSTAQPGNADRGDAAR